MSKLGFGGLLKDFDDFEGFSVFFMWVWRGFWSEGDWRMKLGVIMGERMVKMVIWN